MKAVYSSLFAISSSPSNAGAQTRITPAERVAHDLQAVGRAVIVGETTGNGANPFEYRRISDHFALDLPESKSINPITGTNWQDSGVKPDVEVSAEKALEKALELAKKAIGDAT